MEEMRESFEATEYQLNSDISELQVGSSDSTYKLTTFLLKNLIHLMGFSSASFESSLQSDLHDAKAEGNYLRKYKLGYDDLQAGQWLQLLVHVHSLPSQLHIFTLICSFVFLITSIHRSGCIWAFYSQEEETFQCCQQKGEISYQPNTCCAVEAKFQAQVLNSHSSLIPSVSFHFWDWKCFKTGRANTGSSKCYSWRYKFWCSISGHCRCVTCIVLHSLEYDRFLEDHKNILLGNIEVDDDEELEGPQILKEEDIEQADEEVQVLSYCLKSPCIAGCDPEKKFHLSCFIACILCFQLLIMQERFQKNIHDIITELELLKQHKMMLQEQLQLIEENKPSVWVTPKRTLPCTSEAWCYCWCHLQSSCKCPNIHTVWNGQACSLFRPQTWTFIVSFLSENGRTKADEEADLRHKVWKV